MSEKHIVKGTPFPPLKPGLLRLYSMRYCPYAQRTRLVLLHKNIPHEIININLQHKPEWFLERNTAVPVLEHDDKLLLESGIINYYLDEAYPEKRLAPKDPYVKARHHLLEEKYGKLTSKYYKILRSNGEDKNDMVEYVNALEPFEKALEGDFFGGDEICMLDLMCWPHLERRCLMKDYTGMDPMPADRFPKLTAWCERMMEQPVVKATILTPEVHLKFIRSYISGEHVYDFELPKEE